MSLNAAAKERLNKATHNNTLLASGYVRINSVLDVPFGIIQICLLYYLQLDYWDVNMKGNGLEISGNNYELCECINNDEGHYGIFGTLSVNSGIHHWRFKISKIDLRKKTYTRIVIGVCKMEGINEEVFNEGIAGLDALK